MVAMLEMPLLPAVMAMRAPGFITCASEDFSICAVSSAAGLERKGQGKFQKHSAISGIGISLRNLRLLPFTSIASAHLYCDKGIIYIR
jgi:hypothetical protein